jgi:deazaflavin-dependent oxidoreductase (nitroreductase family)
MQLPRALARFNRRVTNRVQIHWAPLLPGYGVLEHVERRSGAVYRTPLNVFAARDGFVVLLTYGPDTDWLRNLQAAGHADLVHRRRRYRVSEPRVLSGGSGRPLLPVPVRLVSRVARIDGVLRLTATPA